jgi:uncharacterized protein
MHIHMNTTRRHALARMGLGCAALVWATHSTAKQPAANTSAEYPEMAWDQLIPKDWRPDRSLNMLGNRIGLLDDSDPAVVLLMEKIRQAWDSAPTIAALNGKKIRIAGYAVPLDTTPGAIKNMLLVPYFGACVHTPPPPANQIILGRSTKPLDVDMMVPVWLSGTLRTERQTTESGVSGYTLDIKTIEAYTD